MDLPTLYWQIILYNWEYWWSSNLMFWPQTGRKKSWQYINWRWHPSDIIMRLQSHRVKASRAQVSSCANCQSEDRNGEIAMKWSLISMAVHIEDCEGWWLSSCCSSVTQHWLHKPGVLGPITVLFTFFYFASKHLNLFIPTWEARVVSIQKQWDN